MTKPQFNPAIWELARALAQIEPETDDAPDYTQDANSNPEFEFFYRLLQEGYE